ncbi:hypothetical protein [Nonlabens sp. Asnod3-A02]|uniref:hypothetical protein n=1 Tax=Nonlabens sp. Asnod3-A02 TaxID=3160579 RepID=UPI00386BB2A3
MNSKQKDLSKLIADVQKNNKDPVKQKVIPLKKSINQGKVQCSFFIDEELMIRFKTKALKNKLTIKTIITESIRSYVNDND